MSAMSPVRKPFVLVKEYVHLGLTRTAKGSELVS